MSGSLPGMPSAPMPPSLGAGGGAPGGMPPGMPPGMAPPRPNLGPVTQPQGNPGNMAAAMLDIKNASNLLQRALPNVPMGSPEHQDLLAVVTKLAKMAQDVGGDQSMQMQSLMSMVRQMGQNPMQGALARMQPQPNAGPAMGAPPGAPG